MAEEKTNRTSGSKRPYFFWDYDITEDEIREILRSGDEAEKAWVITRILEYARWEDIWKYLTVDDIRENFDRLGLKPYFKELWAYALSIWEQKGGNGK